MDEIDNILNRGVSNILPTKDGLKKLMNERKIKIYQGFDPSMPSLHLGNLVGLMKLRQFQKLGHKIIFLVGDFTGMIGDPTDKMAARQALSRSEVLENALSWKKQIEKVIDFDGNNPAEIKYNSEWLDKMSFKDLIGIASKFTVQQMIERDMFQKRIKEEKPIHLHEFLYPVAQAIDSVEMNVDLEIGGSDQTFNMLAGRTLMRAVKSKEKYVLSTKLLVDDNNEKIGKTTGNALFLDSTPENFFAAVMSFPDSSILLSFELLTEIDLNGLEEKIKSNPLEQKKRLAFEIVKIIWGENDAQKAKRAFETTFQERAPEYENEIEGLDNLKDTLAQIPEVGSIAQAKRLISQKAIDINGKAADDLDVKIKSGDKIKIGKKIFIKIK